MCKYVCGVASKVLKPTCLQRKATALYRDRASVSVWWKNEGTPGHKRFMFLYPRYCFALQGQRMVTLSKLCKCMCVYVSLACLLKPMLLQKGLLDLHLYKTAVEPLNKGHLSNKDTAVLTT